MVWSYASTPPCAFTAHTWASLRLAQNQMSINSLTPNDPYRGRTAPLTSKTVFHIFIQ